MLALGNARGMQVLRAYQGLRIAEVGVHGKCAGWGMKEGMLAVRQLLLFAWSNAKLFDMLSDASSIPSRGQADVRSVLTKSKAFLRDRGNGYSSGLVLVQDLGGGIREVASTYLGIFGHSLTTPVPLV